MFNYQKVYKTDIKLIYTLDDMGMQLLNYCYGDTRKYKEKLPHINSNVLFLGGTEQQLYI